MNNILCKRLYSFILFFTFIVCATSVTASADTGPKPSINIDFIGCDEKIYVTLLSKTSGVGPWQRDEKADRDSEKNYGIDQTIFDKFLSYNDPDEFYLLPYIQECGDEFRFGYFPPNVFKILIYFPKSDTFAVSKIYERYAFHSYFEVNLSGLSYNSDIGKLPVKENHVLSIEAQMNDAIRQNYDFESEITSLIARIIITVFIEIAIAYFFKFTFGKPLWVILFANIFTQIILNLTLNIHAFYRGTGSEYIKLYILFELMIFVCEAFIYVFAFDKLNSGVGRRKIILYAFIANLSSFLVGIKLADFLPKLFT